MFPQHEAFIRRQQEDIQRAKGEARLRYEHERDKQRAAADPPIALCAARDMDTGRPITGEVLAPTSETAAHRA